MEEVFIISGLIGVQIILAVYLLFLHRFLSLGVNSLSLVIFGGLANSLFLLPLAIVLEKKKWPTKLSAMLMAQMFLIALLTVAFQILMLFGIKMTSPAIASAMPNLAPVIIFVIAACARLEKFSIWCKYSRAKVFGTVLCLGGAVAMSFLMTPPSSPDSLALQGSNTLNKEWILGCFYLLCAVVFLSCNTVLQAATMQNFPAPFSLCIISSLMGSILTALMQFIIQGNLEIGSSSLSLESIVSFVLLGAFVTGFCMGFQTWCLNKKGPVMVSIFNPVQTVFSAVLSALVLGQILNVGSLAGMLVMFMGLYVVLWGKKKEDCDTNFAAADDINIINYETGHDIEKPLLT